jgi:hypothetical protein
VRKSRKLKIWQVAEKVDIEVKHLGRIERVSPARFFEFDSAADPKTLRKNIDRILIRLDPKQLAHARQVLSVLF